MQSKLAAVALCLAALAVPAASQPAYPDRPVTLIVPVPPGGILDTVARMVVPSMGQTLGQPVVIDNRAGAGGNIAASAVARAAPDGYTLLVGYSMFHVGNPSMYSNLTWDPLRDFVPVGMLVVSPHVVAVHPSTPAKNLRELVDYAKANPGKLNYASAGNGSATHLGMAYLCAVAGLQMQHIPFKATGEALNEVLSGRVQAIMPASIGALAYLDDPRIRVLGLTSPVGREGALARLKTLSESGVPQFNYDSWYGLLLPATTPAATVEKINQAVARVLADPAVVAALDKAGIVPMKMSTAEFKAFAAKDAAEMRQLVQVSGAKVE